MKHSRVPQAPVKNSMPVARHFESDVLLQKLRSYFIVLPNVVPQSGIGEATLTVVVADAPTTILKIIANYQIYTSNAPPTQNICTPSQPKLGMKS
jgi:hypothetical protein